MQQMPDTLLSTLFERLAIGAWRLLEVDGLILTWTRPVGWRVFNLDSRSIGNRAKEPVWTTLGADGGIVSTSRLQHPGHEAFEGLWSTRNVLGAVRWDFFDYPLVI